MAQEYLFFRGTMRGHTDCVTAIAAPIDNSDIIVTASRDKSLIRWKLTKQEEEEEKTFGVPACRFIGHSDSVEDVVISESGECALSASSDCELLLWDMEGEILCDFVGHTDGVLSVAFSPDDRQILSASRDKTIKLWNNLGDCKFTLQEGDAHSDCVSCVRFCPDTFHRTAVSCSWDNTVKVWDLNRCTLLSTLSGHSGRVNAVVVSPDGVLCASGGEDGVVLLWDPLTGRMIYSLRVGSTVNAMCFCPNRHWLCAATQSSIKIWDLESMSSVADLKVDLKQEIETADSADQATAGENEAIYCTSLTWKADGSILFCGYTDGVIRVWGVDGW